MEPALNPDTLIAQVQSGSVSAFESLVASSKGLVFTWVSRYVPEHAVPEVAQETFLRVWRSAGSFRGDSTFHYWLKTIAVRASHDYWRTVRRSKEVQLSEEHFARVEEKVSAEQFAVEVQREVQHDILQWCLSQLNADDTMVLTLLYLEEHSQQEVAKMLGWSMAKVKVRAFRIRRFLRKRLQAARNDAHE